MKCYYCMRPIDFEDKEGYAYFEELKDLMYVKKYFHRECAEMQDDLVLV